jgi:hypothetical protein
MLGSYKPQMSANGICIHEIIQVWRNAGHEVHVICYGKKSAQTPFIGDAFVHTIKAENTMEANEIAGGRIQSSLKRMVRIVKFILQRPFYPIRFPRQIIAFRRMADQIIKKYNIDTIISVLHPIEAAIAGYRLKLKLSQIEWIIYELDTFTNGNDRLKSPRKRQRIERQLYEAADKIIHMACHKEYYGLSKYDFCRKKLLTADIPLLSANTNSAITSAERKKKSDTIRFLYSGLLRRDVRSPIEVIKILLALSKEKKIKVEFYSRGNYEKYLLKKQKETIGTIQSCGYVKVDELNSAIARSDYLISIGNKSTDMIPSKIFMYMSTLKPIIHFYLQDHDVCNNYLQKYPSALLCDLRDSVEKNLYKLNCFLDRSQNEHEIKFKDIANIFPQNTPEYSSSLILGRISFLFKST